MSALRPNLPIIALTSNIKTYNQLAFIWGVAPLYVENCKNEHDAFQIMSTYAQNEKIVTFGDIIVTTAGVPFGRKGSTNMMVVENIGNILVRGAKGIGKKKTGKVVVVRFIKEHKIKDVEDKIMVIPRCDESYCLL